MKNQIEQTLTSLEVAGMIDKEHKNLLADIRTYIEEISQLNFQPSNYFRENTYKKRGKEYPCYEITKKGCEFVAHKLTGLKGTEFTVKYIDRFHDMEEMIKEGIPEKKSSKLDRTEIMLMNARTRQANLYYKLSQVETLSTEYKNILVSKATEVLSGESIIPLPKTERKTYSAAEIGEKLGISGNKVGRIANKYNLKTEEYGSYYRDKKKHSDGECDTWRYFDTVIPVIAEILSQVA